MAKRRQQRSKACGNEGKNGNKNGRKAAAARPLIRDLSPQKLAVITALLTGALEVDSILVDKDKTIQIVLEGSLRRPTKMDEMVREMSGMKVADLLESIQRL